MFENLKDEKLIAEITGLVNKCRNIENGFEEGIDAYCEFMKASFLATSGLN